MIFPGHLGYSIGRRQFLKYLGMVSLYLEMAMLLFFLDKVPKIREIKYFENRLYLLADSINVLLDELEIKITYQA